MLLEQGRIFEKIKKDKQDKIYLTGKFDPSQRNDFSPVPAELNIGGYKMYLRKETLDAFLKMEEAAEKDNVDLKIASATRNFDYQKKLWNDKWTGVKIVDGKSLLKSIPDELERFKKILEYSAVPGASRHHWGTDFDINDATPEYFETEKGEKVYDWLVENAPSFGFCQPYNVKESERATGYNEEKWHWSYALLSKNFTEEYRNLIKNADIKGFDGDEYVPSFDLINDYVLAINPDCL
ncbi:MAG: M15 family metallopeptidase [Candidatus Nomurabacteria bacterium]|nr:M15 family metallopeptidase [Candidatus Nomurabacteria bacterium]